MGSFSLSLPDSDDSGHRPESRPVPSEPEAQPQGKPSHDRGRKRRRQPASPEYPQPPTNAPAATLLPDHADPPMASDALVIELETQLREKEEIIAALTERLEQAAEQLDRMRRTGGDRGGGLPAETVAEHASLMEDLRQAVQQWQDMQASAAFGRIECQIGELRDIVSGHLLEARPQPRVEERVERHPAPAPPPSNAPKPGSWEAQKALLLGDPLPVSELEAEPEDLDSADTSTPLPLPEAPAALDFESATTLELQAALRERDVYIELLREHLQLACAAPDSSPDIPDLDQLPEAQRAAIRAWENRVQSRLRKSEIEVSLERARLSRDEIALRQQQEQFFKEQRKAGLRREFNISDDELDEKPDDAPQRKRWLGFLGSRAAKDET